MPSDCCPPLDPTHGTNFMNKIIVPTEGQTSKPGPQALSITPGPIRAHAIHTRCPSPIPARPQVPVIGEKTAFCRGRSEDSSRDPGARYPALAPLAAIRPRWDVGGPQRANGGWACRWQSRGLDWLGEGIVSVSTP